ncbi:MAG: glycosyl hydrolase family 18 protein [Actinomycetota bacterium]
MRTHRFLPRLSARALRVVTAALAAAVLAASLLALTFSRGAPPAAAVPGIGSTGRSVSGWLPWWTIDASTTDAVAHGDALSIASPFWYELEGPRKVSGFTGAGSADVVSSLRSTGALVFPTVVESMSASRIVTVFEDATKRGRTISRLVNLAAAHGYDGLDLDFERMASTDTEKRAARIAADYVAFVQRLAARLHADGRGLSVTVMARTAETTWHTGMSATVFDYAGLGAAADVFRVMAYDRHWGGGRPGAIAPLPWVRAIIRYTTPLVPASKVELGVPTYGYDWPDGGHATAVTYRGARALQREHHTTVAWSDTSDESHFSYRAKGVRHRVWFADARSIRIRAQVAEAAGLRGIVLWTLGGEPKSAW